MVTNTLYPYLRKGACLYVTPMPLSHSRSEDLVIYRDEGGAAGLKEVERLPDGRLLLKGLGRGGTLTLEAGELSEINTIIMVARPESKRPTQ